MSDVSYEEISLFPQNVQWKDKQTESRQGVASQANGQ